jgi:hypothetical protein
LEDASLAFPAFSGGQQRHSVACTRGGTRGGPGSPARGISRARHGMVRNPLTFFYPALSLATCARTPCFKPSRL